MATDECGCVLGEGTLESPLVSCREPVGHRGEHRGRSLDGRYGARWPQAKQVDKREREWRYVMEGEATAVEALRGVIHAYDGWSVNAYPADGGTRSAADAWFAEAQRVDEAVERARSEIEQRDTK